MATITERVIDIIIDRLGLDLEDVTPGTKLAEDLGADSLDRIEMMMACEEEFQVAIDDPEAERCTTVADVVALVSQKLARVPVPGVVR